MTDKLQEAPLAEIENEFTCNMVYRHWWQFDGQDELLVAFSGNRKNPLVLFKTRAGETTSMPLRHARLLCDALIHILKTMEPDRCGDGCPTFLQPRE